MFNRKCQIESGLQLKKLSVDHLFENLKLITKGPPNTFVFFFLENALKKKLLKMYSNFFIYLKVQSFRLIMENNFIQMGGSAGHAVVYRIGPIFKHIIDCVQLYFTNGFTNIVLQSVNCLWLVSVTLNGVKSQFRGGQATSALQLIIHT